MPLFSVDIEAEIEWGVEQALYEKLPVTAALVQTCERIDKILAPEQARCRKPPGRRRWCKGRYPAIAAPESRACAVVGGRVFAEAIHTVCAWVYAGTFFTF